MFQEMINGSIAVLSKPSVATFEEHEKDNLTWALIYSVLAGVINAIFTGIKFAISGDSSIAGPSIGGAIVGTIIGLLISWGITFGLGRAFGGTGNFGELAYDLSLFGAPLTAVTAVFSIIPYLGGLVALAAAIYSFYLTYLGIQAGMNLPSQKALYVILIEIVIGIAIVGCIVVSFGTLIALMMAGSSQ